jgi:hypothetical protein
MDTVSSSGVTAEIVQNMIVQCMKALGGALEEELQLMRSRIEPLQKQVDMLAVISAADVSHSGTIHDNIHEPSAVERMSVTATSIPMEAATLSSSKARTRRMRRKACQERHQYGRELLLQHRCPSAASSSPSLELQHEVDTSTFGDAHGCNIAGISLQERLANLETIVMSLGPDSVGHHGCDHYSIRAEGIEWGPWQTSSGEQWFSPPGTDVDYDSCSFQLKASDVASKHGYPCNEANDIAEVNHDHDRHTGVSTYPPQEKPGAADDPLDSLIDEFAIAAALRSPEPDLSKVEDCGSPNTVHYGQGNNEASVDRIAYHGDLSGGPVFALRDGFQPDGQRLQASIFRESAHMFQYTRKCTLVSFKKFPSAADAENWIRAGRSGVQD